MVWCPQNGHIVSIVFHCFPIFRFCGVRNLKMLFISQCFLFFSIPRWKSSGRWFIPITTRDQSMIYPWSTRALSMLTRDFREKPRVSKTNPGFPEPVINPWSTRDLPMTTRDNFMGLNLPKLIIFFNVFSHILRYFGAPKTCTNWILRRLRATCQNSKKSIGFGTTKA